MRMLEAIDAVVGDVRILRDAAREFREAKRAVVREMDEAGARGEFRQNSQMPSWERYRTAEERWTELLEKFIASA